MVHVHLTREEVGGGAGRRLGIEVLEAAAERGIRVTAIHEGGLVAAWNAQRAEGRLLAGDVILEVNGQTEDLTSVLSQAAARGEPLDILAAVPKGAARPGAGAAHELGRAAHVLALPTRMTAVNGVPQESREQRRVCPLATSPCLPSSLPSCGTEPSGCRCEPTRAGTEPASERCSCTAGTSSESTQQAEGPPRRASRGGSVGPPPQSDVSHLAAHSSGCMSEPLPLGRIDPARFNSSSSTQSPRRRSHSSSSLGLPAVQTVQTVRHQREDGLVEAMVNDQGSLVSDGSFCTVDSLGPEGHVSAPLWLRICGILPWGQRGVTTSSALRSCYWHLVLVSVVLIVCFLAFAAVYAPSGSCKHEACLGYAQITDLALAVGSLLGLLAMQSLSSLGILGSAESILVAYARRQEITGAWSAAVRGHSARLAGLWACSAALRLVSLVGGPWPSPLDVATAGCYAVTSLVFLGVVSGILHVSCALTLVIDSYATHFDGAHFRLETSVHEWNLLQAVLRKVSGAAERGFMAVQSTAVALVTGVMLAARGPLRGEAVGEAVGAGDAAWLSSAALLVVGAAFIFFKTAEVSERCMRMPSVINSLNFGECVDARRHYLVEFIKYSAAGFYVWEVRLTAAVALKLTYFCCILAFAGLSQLYAQDL
ncbi:unnamed protein product [Prorocentrum cordatum]|uniref:PDZ domain-containing protein n=1 Tax=Prorocentrum cordatum TaxID=2364126 RepID=A0ABN9PG48_9DINO|nr:unnamed protein product [Polarella glacialis]